MTEKLAKASFSFLNQFGESVWSPDDVDKLESKRKNYDEFVKIVRECRFFYQKDPIASTVINKLVEISIGDIHINKENLSSNEYRIFQSLIDGLEEFAESCALEYLISGLVVPEIKYATVPIEELKQVGIKKYSSLTLPVSMWLRDPTTIKINDVPLMNSLSYYVVVPEKLVSFILSNGVYPDGTKDIELYKKLVLYYPSFVEAIRKGEREILLENNLIIRRKVVTGSPYPIPYLEPVLESMRHKRNLRKMDYSLASRVITAIQVIRLGNDTYPVTEDDESAFDAIKEQMSWRNSYGRDIERIFQLFANHTLDIEWVMPDTQILLDDRKYAVVNDDIFFGLGFPRILTTGEAQRTGASDPEFASLSPLKTMENMRRKILFLLQKIIYEVAKANSLNAPKVRFSPISLHSFRNLIEGLRNLYDSGNISRTTYAGAFGYDLEEELRTKSKENEIIEELGIEKFAPKPYSPKPETPVTNNGE